MSTYAMVKPSARARAAGRRHAWANVRRRASLILVCFLLILLLPSDGYLGPARSNLVINLAIGGHGFRLAAWEVQALGSKLGDLVTRPGHELTPAQQHDLVVAYFDAVGRIGDLGWQIERIYADPKQSDPHAAAAPLQAELDELRALQQARHPAVERILEQQTAEVLRSAGLTTPLTSLRTDAHERSAQPAMKTAEAALTPPGMGARPAVFRSGAGAVWPPVRFRFTESPAYLIVSPRDRIVLQKGMFVDPALSVAQMEQIEAQVQSQLDVSALVEGTGGFSAYPTMIIEYADLSWVVNTIAHEWVHTYLVFHPLGWHYLDSGDTRTLNETVASIVGEEIGRQVLARFYPEKLPPADWPRPLAMRADWWQRPPAPPFEFGAFMRQTRLRADKLLAAGRVAEAEAYMEAQRQVAVAHGYVLRKLNQAYFAFHGAYAVGPAATDPIGGKLRALRQRSGSLAAFVQTVARITSVAELDAALGG